MKSERFLLKLLEIKDWFQEILHCFTNQVRNDNHGRLGMVLLLVTRMVTNKSVKKRVITIQQEHDKATLNTKTEQD